MENIVKIGNVELPEENVARLYAERKYLVTYSKVYQINYSAAQGRYYGTVVYSKPLNSGVGLVRRGRFLVMDAEQVNDLLGASVLA